MTFMDQFGAAKREAAELAKTTPHIFPEWQVLQGRKQELEQAQRNLEAAQRAWDAILKGGNE